MELYYSSRFNHVQLKTVYHYYWSVTSTCTVPEFSFLLVLTVCTGTVHNVQTGAFGPSHISAHNFTHFDFGLRTMKSLLVTTAIAIIGAVFLAFADKHAPNSLRKRGLQIVDPRTVDLKQLADNHNAAPAGFSPLCRSDQPDSWKNELFCRIDRIRIACGDLCTINDRESLRSRQIPNPSGGFPRIEAKVDRDSIFATDDIDAGDPSVPIPHPEELVPFYTMDGLIDLIPDKRLENVYLGGTAFRNVWTREKVEEQMASVAEGTLRGSYGPEVTNQVRDTLRTMDLEGKSVLVIGSEQSWLEAICLYLGAASVTILEYGEIESQHPKIQTIRMVLWGSLIELSPIRP